MDQRRSGYLANIYNLPPLIFRFQFNPEMITEKKSFKYTAAQAFGNWGFDQVTSKKGRFAKVLAAYDDVKEFGSLLVGVKPLEPVEGDPRTFDLEFKLDGSVPGPADHATLLDSDGGDHYGGSIIEDLEVLRSFTVPTWDAPALLKMLVAGQPSCFNTPPTCTLQYGALSVECVMTDLTIKVVAFWPDGHPRRAEVSCTLKEQTFSPDPILGTIHRLSYVSVGYRHAQGADVVDNLPIAGTFR